MKAREGIKKSQRISSDKRKKSRDLDSKRLPINYKEMLSSSSKHKSRSKRPKSNKFTFLTINNFGCKKFKFDCGTTKTKH